MSNNTLSEKQLETLNEQVKVFDSIIRVITGCQIAKKGEKGYFDCKNCDKIGECFSTASECIAGIAYWIKTFLEGHIKGEDFLIKAIENLKNTEEDDRTALEPPKTNYYL